MRRVKIIDVILLIVILIIFLAFIIIGEYFCNLALNPKMDKTFVMGNMELTDGQKKWLEEPMDWLNENSTNVYIYSTNNGSLKLHGYEIKRKKPSNLWAIVIHGYMGKASDMTGFCKKINQSGFNVLMPDLRGHGQSEGKYIGMGWHDRLDIIDWINYIISRDSESKIILFGISMGAATVMMTTGEMLPENVKLAISDCGYTSVWEQFGYQLKLLFKIPKFPVLYAANTICIVKNNYSFKDASAEKQVKKSKIPILFIHGDADKFVPFNMLETLYEAANCKKEKLVIKGADHADSWEVNSKLYWKTIDNFIQKHI